MFIETELNKEDFLSCSEYQDWHKHWIYLDKNGKYYAYEPDNTCISEGTLLEACTALNNSEYGDNE